MNITESAVTHAHCDGKFTDTFAAKISDAALQPVFSILLRVGG